jgi:hypothetical protein
MVLPEAWCADAGGVASQVMEVPGQANATGNMVLPEALCADAGGVASQVMEVSVAPRISWLVASCRLLPMA